MNDRDVDEQESLSTLNARRSWKKSMTRGVMTVFAISLALLLAEPLGLAQGPAFRFLGVVGAFIGLFLKFGNDVLGDFTPREAIGRSLAILSAAVLLLVLLWLIRPTQLVFAELSGDVNVGLTTFDVNELGTQQAVDESLGLRFAEGIGKEIERLRLGAMEGSGIQLQVGVVADNQPFDDGESASDEAQAWAVEVAQASNSDFLVSGTLDVSNDRTDVDVLLFVDAARVPDSPELSGWYSAGEPFTVSRSVARSGNTAALGELRVQLSSSLVALIEFASILESLDERATLDTVARLEALAALEDGLRIVPKSLVHLILGNAKGRLACVKPTSCDKDMLAEARKSYKTAIKHDGGSRRARLGLAELELQQAQGDCGATVDPSIGRLGKARQMFEQIRASEDSPSIVYAKASLGVSRVVACLVSAGLEEDDSAVLDIARQLERASEVDSGVPRQIVAETYSYSGLTASWLGNYGEAVRRFEEAIGHSNDMYRSTLWKKFKADALASVPECSADEIAGEYDVVLDDYDSLIERADGARRQQLVSERDEASVARTAVLDGGCSSG